MKIFFDTEFTGLHKDTDLISIGMITETGDEFYAEFTDYDINKAPSEDDKNWLQNEVINNLSDVVGIENIMCDTTNYHKGTREEIRDALSVWLEKFDEVEFVSDVCHYDFVLLIDLFGTAFDLPDNVAVCCHDINQDIADDMCFGNCKEAFDISRESYLGEISNTFQGNKHNALYDARVIREIYQWLRS